MGLLRRLFGKRTADAATSANRARQQDLAGKGFSQTAAEQQGTRDRMEAELLGQRQRREQPVAPPAEPPPCPHTTLVPSWDSVADMGKEDKVTAYTCEGCQQHFTAEEGRALRATEATRLQQGLSS
jgi:hypothetical protein